MQVYRFQGFELDTQARRLAYAGAPVDIEPRVFDILVYLVEQRHRAVDRAELIAAAWGRTDSSDATLAQAVVKARRIFGDDGESQRFIRTIVRFGYQWVAPTEAVERSAEPAPASVAASPGARMDAESADANAPRSRRFARRWIAAALVAALAVFAFALRGERSGTPADPAHAAVKLVLVAPAEVHDATVQDGWMRLGLMAMGADALRDLAGYAVVPNESVLAAAGTSSAGTVNAVSAQRLQAITGAATVVAIDARRSGGGWHLAANLMAKDGDLCIVEAENADAAAAGAELAERLRVAFGGERRSAADASAESCALAARMQAALLEGHPAQALAAAEGANAGTITADVVLLEAKALMRLGRAEEAVNRLAALIERKDAAKPLDRAAAWATRGYAELVGGHPDLAERAFREAVALSGEDRRHKAAGWRGLGETQVAQGRIADAEASLARARFELGDANDRFLLANIDNGLASIAMRRGRVDDALARYRSAAAAAASVGAVELELGVRMNIALALDEQLRHSEALADWRELLPRLRELEHPSMQRHATVDYAAALIEVGELTEARTQLAHAADANDAFDDVRLDGLYLRHELGDDAALRKEAQQLAASARAQPMRAAAAALLVQADLAIDDVTAAQAAAASLAADDGGEERSVRIQTLAAKAALAARTGADRDAETSYRAALALASEAGSPRELRNVALPYADYLAGRGHVDEALSTASLLQRYAEDDFDTTLALARFTALRSPEQARALFERAHRLAGERSVPPAPTAPLTAQHMAH